MSSRYANRVYAGRSFPNPFAQCNQASCSSIRIELRLRRRPDFGIEAPGHFLFAAPTSYRDPAIEQIHFGKNDSSWSTNDKTTLILIFKIPCCNCILPAANLHYFRRCSCGATSRARVSPGKSVGVRRRRKVCLVKLPTVVDKNKHRDLTSTWRACRIGFPVTATPHCRCYRAHARSRQQSTL